MPKTKILPVENVFPPMTSADVNQMLGAARYAEWLANQSESHVLQFLMTVQEKELFIPAGYQSFELFIEASGLKSRATYYRKRELLLKEGSEQYDLFEEWRIPAATRRLIEAGDIKIDGSEVTIGDQIVQMGDSTIIKQVIERLVKEKIETAKHADKVEKDLHKTDQRLKREQATSDDLQTKLDDLTNKTVFEVALGDLMTSAVQLQHIVRYELDPDDRDRRAEKDCRAIDLMLHEIKDAYGIAEWQLMMAKEASNA